MPGVRSEQQHAAVHQIMNQPLNERAGNEGKHKSTGGESDLQPHESCPVRNQYRTRCDEVARVGEILDVPVSF